MMSWLKTISWLCCILSVFVQKFGIICFHINWTQEGLIHVWGVFNVNSIAWVLSFWIDLIHEPDHVTVQGLICIHLILFSWSLILSCCMSGFLITRELDPWFGDCCMLSIFTRVIWLISMRHFGFLLVNWLDPCFACCKSNHLLYKWPE